MIKIDESTKRILFQRDFEIGKSSVKTHECELVSAYVCPKCEEILLAYFKSDEYVKVWEYDEKEKEKNYSSDSDLRYYSYRVFYAGCGIMGMELKEHNGYNSGCSFKVNQSYNIVSSVNNILYHIEEELNNATDDKKVSIKRLPKGTSRIRLIQNLKEMKEIELIPDVCDSMDPLVRLNSVEYKKTDTYEYEYDSPERKEAEKANYEALKGAYAQVIRRIKAYL